MSTWKLFFDGAFTNGEPMYGWCLTREGIEVARGHGIVDRLNDEKTTNVAEYGGLVAGLVGSVEWLRQYDQLTVFGDSQLVIRQMSGQYRIKKVHLMPYAEKAKKVIKTIQEAGVSVVLDWIPREQNTRADELSKMAVT